MPQATLHVVQMVPLVYTSDKHVVLTSGKARIGPVVRGWRSRQHHRLGMLRLNSCPLGGGHGLQNNYDAGALHAQQGAQRTVYQTSGGIKCSAQMRMYMQTTYTCFYITPVIYISPRCKPSLHTTLPWPGLTGIACGAMRCILHARVLARGTSGGASARRPPLRLSAVASAARGTNGGASARSLLRATSAAAPLPVPVAAAALAGLAAGAAVPAGAACSSCSSLARTCGAKPLPPLLQPASAAGAGGVAAPALRVVAAGGVTSDAALVAALQAGASGRLLRPSAAAAGADSAALSRRAAGASAHSGKACAAALSLACLAAAAGGSGGRPAGGLDLISTTSVARSVAGAAMGAASCVKAAGAAATSAAAAAEARGACSRNAAGYQCHVLRDAYMQRVALGVLLRTLPANASPTLGGHAALRATAPAT
jgi:hypothetical protein